MIDRKIGDKPISFEFSLGESPNLTSFASVVFLTEIPLHIKVVKNNSDVTSSVFEDCIMLSVKVNSQAILLSDLFYFSLRIHVEFTVLCYSIVFMHFVIQIETFHFVGFLSQVTTVTSWSLRASPASVAPVLL